MASSVVANHIAQTQAPFSTPLRNIFLTLSLTILMLATVGYVWAEAGYEMLIVAMGWPHVLLGFAFYFGRVLRGEANAGLSFLLLSILTVTFWIIHYKYAITGLIYLFFLYHAFRDEVFVYLQTRSHHRTGRSVFAIAGLGPLILLMLLIPQQQDFRQDLRRVEFSSDQQFARSRGWTLIPFKVVPNSRGRDFYFFLQAPHTAGVRAFVTHATTSDTQSTGEIRVGDEPWSDASDLVFLPHYAGDQSSPPETAGQSTIPVLLTGGHRVGQTFTATQNDFAGIWLPIDRLESQPQNTQFVFRLTSPPLLPYAPPLATVRIVLIVLLSLLIAWKLFPRRGQHSQLWIYLLILGSAFGIIQMIVKSSGNAGYPFPLIFQFVVIFHYWSWYVFSYDKIRAQANTAVKPAQNQERYQRLLAHLRQGKYFTVVVIMLNLISALGVFWYYRLGGPSALRYMFDYSYFLYFLVFHVTFSFNPRLRWLEGSRQEQ
jgi:hypothetical protein